MTYNFDTRNNWVTFMFVCKNRFNCFGRQSVIDSCIAGFKELEKFGFKFGKFGFGGTHTHFVVDIPKNYSPQNAEIMLKDHSAKRIFAEHPGFRKRYPKNSFWSGYEHHESTGRKDRNESEAYIESQPQHHNIHVIDDYQQKLIGFTAERGYVNARAHEGLTRSEGERGS